MFAHFSFRGKNRFAVKLWLTAKVFFLILLLVIRAFRKT